MEKLLVDTTKSSAEGPPFAFPPHRRRPLRSETYRTFLRIVSHCYNQPQKLRPDANGSCELRRNGEKNGKEDEELAVVGTDQHAINETQLRIEEIDNLLSLGEEGDVGKEKELMGDDSGDGSREKERGVGQMQQLLMKELEDVIKGNGESGRDGSCEAGGKLLGKNESVHGGVVEGLDNATECCNDQRIGMEKSGDVVQELVDEELCWKNVGENFDLSLDKGMATEASKPIDSVANEGSSLSVGELEVNLEMQQKEREMEKSVCTGGTTGSPSFMMEEGEIEEGEVPGGFEVNDWLVDMVSDNAVMSKEKKADEKHASEVIADTSKPPVNGQSEVNRKGNVVGDASNDRPVVADESARVGYVYKRKVVTYEDPLLEGSLGLKKQKIHHEAKEQREASGAKGEIKGIVALDSFGCPTRNQGIASKQMEDGDPCQKKRGGKENKKKKERKKRAEKNRELGVKRLKLSPVVHAKPVAYCRHYLKGRCQEGEKCKFSHDTVPLTKSKACCHFARHSCMKGDDCPFDHQLSKYPCSNFVSKGSCSRGETCMFSHKLPLKVASSSTSNVCTPEPKPPPLPGTSNSKKQVSGTSVQTAKALPHFMGVMPYEKREPEVPKSVLAPLAQVPKGISFPSGWKSPPVVGSSYCKPGSSSSKGDEGDKIGNPIYQCASDTVQKFNDKAKEASPAVLAKGINFLSFGRSPMGYSSTRKLTSWSSNGGDSAQLSPSNNLNIKQASLSSNMINKTLVGKEVCETMSETPPRLNGIPQKNELAGAAPKQNPFSFADSSTDSARRNSQDSMPSTLGRSVDGSVEASNQVSDKHHNVSAISRAQSTFPLRLGQSFDSSASECLKGTPSSAQKVIESTLAFASKIESEMRKNGLASYSPALSSSKEIGGSGSSGGSQNNTAKASKILDFLSGISGKARL